MFRSNSKGVLAEQEPNNNLTEGTDHLALQYTAALVEGSGRYNT